MSVQEGARATWRWPSTAGPAWVVTCFRGLWPADSGVAGRNKRELLTCEHSTWDFHGPTLRSTYREKHVMSFLVSSDHRLSFLFGCKMASPSNIIERNAFIGDLL